MTDTTYLATFEGEDGMTALVYVDGNKAGCFAAAVRDDDSGQILPTTFHGYANFDAACAMARSLILEVA